MRRRPRDFGSRSTTFDYTSDLPFTLLSDEGGKVRNLYGVPNTLGLFPGRVTYLIDEGGVVRHIFSSQLDVERHVEEAIKALQGHDRIPRRT